MKILIATGLYPPEIGGPATYTALLERELPQRDIEVVVVPFSVVRFLPKGLRHLAYICMLVLSARNVSCIYALDPVSVGFPACIASFLIRKPLLLRVAGDYAWEQAQGRYGITDTLDVFLTRVKEYSFRVRQLVALERFVARRTRHIIVPSKYLKHVVAQWGIDEENITVIYNASDPPEVSGTKEEIQKTSGYSGKVIVSAGRLVPWKGFQALLDIIPPLRKEVGEVTVVIAGDGPQRAALEAHAEECGVEDSVQFVGSLGKDDLAHVIKGADAFVLNTGYEGLSHQLLEVMALGVPIVTTDVGGNPELITDSKEGLLVSFNNHKELAAAVQRILTDEQLRNALVTAAQAKAQLFTTDRMINEFVEFLGTRNLV